MNKEEIIKIGDLEITVERKRIKNIYFGIKDQKPYMKVPYITTNSKILELAKSKESWFRKKLNSSNESREIDLKNKDYVYVLDRKIPIEYIYEKRKTARLILNENECKIILPDNLNLSLAHIEKIEKKLNDILKSLARKYIYEAMDKYIKITGLAPQKIEIRKFKSIWGNCNSNKIIKMNQNLVHYGKDQIEYVCLHELTHLKHMNHSKRFWAHVEKYMPNYKQISKVLKG